MATPGIRDVHLRLASVFFQVPESEVPLDQRKQAKKLCFEIASLPQTGQDTFLSRFLKASRQAQGHLTDAQAEEVQGLLETLHVMISQPRAGWISESGPVMHLGIYDHFKGGVYLADLVVRWAEDGDCAVVYVSMLFGTWHARRCSEWAEVVKWPDGKYRSRFVFRGVDLKVAEPSFKVPNPSQPSTSLPPQS